MILQVALAILDTNVEQLLGLWRRRRGHDRPGQVTAPACLLLLGPASAPLDRRTSPSQSWALLSQRPGTVPTTCSAWGRPRGSSRGRRKAPFWEGQDSTGAVIPQEKQQLEGETVADQSTLPWSTCWGGRQAGGAGRPPISTKGWVCL